jgi:hypothetical protein
VADGDLVVACVRAPLHGSNTDDVESTGFVLHSSQHDHGDVYSAVMTKTSSGSEPASYDFSFPIFTGSIEVAVFKVSGGSLASVTYFEQTSSVSDAVTFPATTATKDAAIVRFASLSTNATSFDSAPSGTDMITGTAQLDFGLWQTTSSAGAVSSDSLGFTANKRNIGATVVFEDTSASSASITNIDSDNNVQVGQTGAVITTTGIDAASVTQAVTLGGESLTITNWATDAITVTIPASINIKWGRTDLQLAVTHDGGTTTLDNVTLSAPSGWETVTLTSLNPNAGTDYLNGDIATFEYHARTDASLGGGGYTMIVGDVLAWTTSAGLTVDGQTVPVVDPAATVTGSYKIWDDTLATWSSTSTYTITDDGIYTGEPANDATAIVQPMVSNIVKDMVN